MISATIVSKDGTLADGLSTSLFIMGKEKAVQYWKKHKEQFDFVLLLKDGTIVISEGIEKIFTSDFDYEVVRDE